MNWQLDKKRPICPQLCEQICVMIARGDVNPDERIPSVRDIAVSAGVNPNTVQKAFDTLEKDNILYSVRGAGWYVGNETEKAKNMLLEIRRVQTKEYFEIMSQLGLTKEETIEYIKGWTE